MTYEELVKVVLAIGPEPGNMAWVAKYAVTVYHGCDQHGGDWLRCDKGPCPLFRQALTKDHRTAEDVA